MDIITRKDINYKLGLMSFILYMIIFTVIDSLNMSYKSMSLQYGFGLVLTNISLNIIMSGMSTYLILLNDALLKVKGIQSKGEHLSIGAILFGILTYGCTPCVISFFASIGIGFSVAVLPFAGLPYKLISVGLIVIGIVWTHFEMRRKSCRIKI